MFIQIWSDVVSLSRTFVVARGCERGVRSSLKLRTEVCYIEAKRRTLLTLARVCMCRRECVEVLVILVSTPLTRPLPFSDCFLSLFPVPLFRSVICVVLRVQ